MTNSLLEIYHISLSHLAPQGFPPASGSRQMQKGAAALEPRQLSASALTRCETVDDGDWK